MNYFAYGSNLLGYDSSDRGLTVAPLMRASILLMLMLPAHAFAQNETKRVQRMGAYQCLGCVDGGFLSGIREGGGGRVLREFPPGRRLCVASYRVIDGEQYVFFQLESMSSKTDGAWTIRREGGASGVNSSGERFSRITLDDGGWPDGGAWGVKSSSWNAECHDAKTK
jgi:hypothetical protein